MTRKTQTDAVIEIMERKGGYATLLDLYRLVQDIKDVKWTTGTPDASIRRIVQDSKHFFKIKPGLWALNSHKNKLPYDIRVLIDEDGLHNEKRDYSSHSYNQGLLINTGNMLGFKTYVPSQDKSRKYLDKPLHDIANLTTLPKFTYDLVLRRIKSIDVVWLQGNEQTLFPSKVFEVENSTDFIKSFNKFYELRNFTTSMTIVAPFSKKKLFEETICWDIYEGLKDRVEFWDYDQLEKFYQQCLSSSTNPLIKPLQH